jgi:hypothetical protein
MNHGVVKTVMKLRLIASVLGIFSLEDLMTALEPCTRISFTVTIEALSLNLSLHLLVPSRIGARATPLAVSIFEMGHTTRDLCLTRSADNALSVVAYIDTSYGPRT